MPSVTVTGAVSVVAGELVSTAVIVTVAGLGVPFAGAAYNPVASIVPCVESPPLVPFTCHVTAVLLDDVTVALNCCDLPFGTLACFGDTVMPGVALGVPAVVVLREPPHPLRASKIKKPNGQSFLILLALSGCGGSRSTT